MQFPKLIIVSLFAAIAAAAPAPEAEALAAAEGLSAPTLVERDPPTLVARQVVTYGPAYENMYVDFPSLLPGRTTVSWPHPLTSHAATVITEVLGPTSQQPQMFALISARRGITRSPHARSNGLTAASSMSMSPHHSK